MDHGKRFSAFQRSFLLILLTAVSLLASASAWAVNDVVYDLDQTLINKTTPAMAMMDSRGIFEWEGEIYRFSDHALDLVALSHQIPDTRVSYFSAGSEARNQAVMAVIYKEMDRRFGAGKYRPHLVLNREALSAQPNVPEDAPFWRRYKKDLSRYFDLSSVILIDDLEHFVPDGQALNMLFIGTGYNDRPRYDLAELEDLTLKRKTAPNFDEWQRERNKLIRVAAILQAASQLVQSHGLGFTAAIGVVLKSEREGHLDAQARGLKLLSPCAALFRAA